VNRSIFRFQPQLTTDMGNDGTNGVPQDAFYYEFHNFSMNLKSSDFKELSKAIEKGTQ
jgi:hypothetical protein